MELSSINSFIHSPFTRANQIKTRNSCQQAESTDNCRGGDIDLDSEWTDDPSPWLDYVVLLLGSGSGSGFHSRTLLPTPAERGTGHRLISDIVSYRIGRVNDLVSSGSGPRIQ
ncbi:hypothetical protein CEP54_010812 [Fusarium duplospermum]|uniref:Uncharacterized protein n=1 Tax=Fusarium duplospermum TaxID=1325734 RepID=A0A428PHR6_9HYPO|nr:hypothetical protein CEP54_010812 [Fusarium duplospermum]